ncbi:class I SAM-dependent methyltransferase [Verrucomicrobium sp. BvORR034]|uniref:class I SAM-dependent methyltransferase n=1 Tax=Verrucomicrobium sp. BvORR034 TaxID=1396418 RepID=UPI00067898C8|nr:class I SAM-dependent methyltransferase [Verrucomicrobium sp. BvORR034]
MSTPVIDQTKLESFVMRAIGDLSASSGGILVSLGHKLGLYKAMAGAGPLTSQELADRADCAERYVREWLNGQVAGGYVQYHAVSSTYELSPEQAMVLADEDSPVFMPHAWSVQASMWFDEDKAAHAFRSGKGVSWGEHHDRLYCGVAAFYRNAYKGSLVSQWLPALEGVVEKLEAGMDVADVGCGHGHSTLLMARAFPKSRFYGYDVHQPSIEEARGLAVEDGLEGNTEFEVARATDYPDQKFGLICFFDCLHDMGDPVAAAQYAAKVLSPGGTVLLVEPFANDRTEDNISPVARLYYTGSTMLCCPHAVSEGGHMVLGAQAGEARLAEVFRKAGFTKFRCAVKTPFNLVLEARR